jgi:hypothetical protein
MAMIYVKARPGRKIPYEGKFIPEDKFIPVHDIPYTRRLIEHWNDVEVQGDAAPARQSRKEPKEMQRPVTGPDTVREPSGNPAPGTGAPRPRD